MADILVISGMKWCDYGNRLPPSCGILRFTLANLVELDANPMLKGYFRDCSYWKDIVLNDPGTCARPSGDSPELYIKIGTEQVTTTEQLETQFAYLPVSG